MIPAATSFARLGWILQSGHVAQCPLCRGDFGAEDLFGRVSAKALYEIDASDGYIDAATCPVCLADVAGQVIAEHDYDCDYEARRSICLTTYDVTAVGDSTPLRPGLPAALVALHAERLNGPASALAWSIACNDYEGLCTLADQARLAALCTYCQVAARTVDDACETCHAELRPVIRRTVAAYHREVA